jgi:hypothetical protein
MASEEEKKVGQNAQKRCKGCRRICRRKKGRWAVGSQPCVINDQAPKIL